MGWSAKVNVADRQDGGSLLHVGLLCAGTPLSHSGQRGQPAQCAGPDDNLRFRSIQASRNSGCTLEHSHLVKLHVGMRVKQGAVQNSSDTVTSSTRLTTF